MARGKDTVAGICDGLVPADWNALLIQNDADYRIITGVSDHSVAEQRTKRGKKRPDFTPFVQIFQNGAKNDVFLHRFPTMRHLNGKNSGKRDDATTILVTH